MPKDYGGVLKDRAPSNTPQNSTPSIENISGNLTRETFTQDAVNDALGVSNSDYTSVNGSIHDPNLSGAYSQMVEVEPPSPDNKLHAAPSHVSDYALFYHPRCDTKNKYLDLNGDSNAFPAYQRYPTMRSLLSDFAGDPTQRYHYSDFVYAMYHEKISMNHLITLRRFPFPTYDNLKFDVEGEVRPIAQAITYFGEPTENSLNELLKMSGYINWEELEADVWDAEGDERGVESTPFWDKLGNRSQRNVKIGSAFLSGDRDRVGGFAQQDQEYAKQYSDFNYTNEVLGPVNVINKTYVRQRGVGATNSYSLVFEYELKSIGNINPKLAMLDIMANMLALSYSNAKFWGGANRYFPNLNSQQYGFLGDQNLFYQGRYGEYLDSFLSQVSGSLGRGLDTLTGVIGNLVGGNYESALDAVKSIASGAGKMMFDLQRSKSRPKVVGLRALLTGLPVGEWHLTIGNPYNPIFRSGNMICTGFDMEFDGMLGPDDHPERLKFTINLEHGRPLDKGDVESKFNLGQGRMYHPPAGFEDVLNVASSSKSIVKESTGNTRNPQKRNDISYLSPPDENSLRQSKAIQDRISNTASVDFVKRLKGSLF